MKKIILFICLLPFSVFGQTAPQCDDDKVVFETEKKAKQMIIDNVKQQIRLSNDMIENLTFDLRDIRNIGLVDSVGAYVCHANLNMVFDNQVMKTYPIVYTVEIASRSKLGFFITIMPAAQ